MAEVHLETFLWDLSCSSLVHPDDPVHRMWPDNVNSYQVFGCLCVQRNDNHVPSVLQTASIRYMNPPTLHRSTVETRAGGARLPECMSPYVSIVVPVYNVVRYLRECLDSVLAQTFDAWECICVDDGSTDGSSAILDDYRERDGRFRVVRQANGGLSVARNTGMGAATGKYLYFLDSDDMLEPNALRRMTEYMDSHHLDQLIFGTSLLVEDGAATAREVDAKSRFYSIFPDIVEKRISGPELFGRLVQTKSFFASVPLRCFRRDSIPTWLCFPAGVIHEDEYFSPLALSTANSAAIIADKLYVRRIRKGSITTTVDSDSAWKHATALRDVARMILRDSKKIGISSAALAFLRVDADNLRMQAYSHVGFPRSPIGKMLAFWRIGGIRLLLAKLAKRLFPKSRTN